MAVRTLQEFLASYAWNHARLRDLTRQRIVADHLPGPGEAKEELGETGEIKYFVSNAPATTKLTTLLRVAFSRWGVEHVFRLARTEIGFDHYEGRTYQGLIRHMLLCQRML